MQEGGQGAETRSIWTQTWSTCSASGYAAVPAAAAPARTHPLCRAGSSAGARDRHAPEPAQRRAAAMTAAPQTCSLLPSGGDPSPPLSSRQRRRKRRAPPLKAGPAGGRCAGGSSSSCRCSCGRWVTTRCRRAWRAPRSDPRARPSACPRSSRPAPPPGRRTPEALPAVPAFAARGAGAPCAPLPKPACRPGAWRLLVLGRLLLPWAVSGTLVAM